MPSVKESPARPVAARLDRIGLWIFTVGAAIVAAVSAWALVMTAGRLLGWVGPDGPTLRDTLTNTGVPPLFDEQRGAVEAIGEFQSYGVEDPGGVAAQLYLWGAVVDNVAVLCISLMVLLLCVKLLRGAPFSRSVTWAVGGAGIVLMVSGVAAHLLQELSRAVLLDGIRVFAAANNVTLPEFSISIDLAPIAAGLVLGVVATAFQLGERMQRDTDGLV